MRLVVKNKEEGSELLRDGNYKPAAARYVKVNNIVVGSCITIYRH